MASTPLKFNLNKSSTLVFFINTGWAKTDMAPDSFNRDIPSLVEIVLLGT